MNTSRRTLLKGAAAASILVAGGASAASAAPTSKVGTGSGHLTATFQTPGQERALLPGGWLVGKVGLAIINPFVAYASNPGDYTLADLKAANPGCVFLFYVNGAVVRPNSGKSGVFETTIDLQRATDNGWIAKDASGNPVRYDTGYVVSNLTNSGYRDAFADLCTKILTTPSTSSHGAKSTTFDGVFLDDTNMSPQHGLDKLNGFGPYASNADYGNAMVDFAADIATRIRKNSSSLRVVCNIGADSWDTELTTRALTLAAKRFGSGPLFDGFLREFTTYWSADYKGKNPGVTEVKATLAFGDNLVKSGVRLYTNDYAPPAADQYSGPTSSEQADWDRRQRLTGGVDLLMGPGVTAGAVVTVPYGRAYDSDNPKEQVMSSPIGSMDNSIMRRLISADPNNAPVGSATISGNVISRPLKSGTVYVNLGTSPATVAGTSLAGRDAVIV